MLAVVLLLLVLSRFAAGGDNSVDRVFNDDKVRVLGIGVIQDPSERNQQIVVIVFNHFYVYKVPFRKILVDMNKVSIPLYQQRMWKTQAYPDFHNRGLCCGETCSDTAKAYAMVTFYNKRVGGALGLFCQRRHTSELRSYLIEDFNFADSITYPNLKWQLTPVSSRLSHMRAGHINYIHFYNNSMLYKVGEDEYEKPFPLEPFTIFPSQYKQRFVTQFSVKQSLTLGVVSFESQKKVFLFCVFRTADYFTPTGRKYHSFFCGDPERPLDYGQMFYETDEDPFEVKKPTTTRKVVPGGTMEPPPSPRPKPSKPLITRPPDPDDDYPEYPEGPDAPDYVGPGNKPNRPRPNVPKDHKLQKWDDTLSIVLVVGGIVVLCGLMACSGIGIIVMTKRKK